MFKLVYKPRTNVHVFRKKKKPKTLYKSDIQLLRVCRAEILIHVHSLDGVE